MVVELMAYDGSVILVDEADLGLLGTRNWSTQTNGSLKYAIRKTGGVRVLMHRVIVNAGPGDVVDHIDGNGLNNTRANLRLCTHTQNMQNRRMHKNNATGVIGVYFDANRKIFRAEIRANCKRHYLGSFQRIEDAAAARAAAELQFHGEFRGSVRHGRNVPFFAQNAHP